MDLPTQYIFTSVDGNVWHTVRNPYGGWTGLGKVNGQIPGPVVAVAAAETGEDEAQFMFATEDGKLWHTLRTPDGKWPTRLESVNGQFSIPGAVRAVAGTVAGIDETQWIFTVGLGGQLCHTSRNADGSWTGLGNVNGQIDVPGPVVAVAAAGDGRGDTQFMFVTSDGHLWHTLRHGDDHTWTPTRDVSATLRLGPVLAVAGTGASDQQSDPNAVQTQWIIATTSGTILYASRSYDGSWTQEEIPWLDPFSAIRVGAAKGIPGELQVVVVDKDGHLWHSLRDGPNNWTGRGDLTAQFYAPPAADVAATGWPVWIVT